MWSRCVPRIYPSFTFAGSGWRRVVASPWPLEIVKAPTVKRLIAGDVNVIAAGGGGIPVVRDGKRLRGVDTVIDKDLAPAVPARALNADHFIMLTDVLGVSLFFNTSQQWLLSRMSASEAIGYLRQNHFPEGSMGPKVEAAVDFASSMRRPAIITSPELLERASRGKDGTAVYSN